MYDVAVVGAGPAGSAAAYHLARGGVRVVLLDQSAFPRDKACGDILGPDALASLERTGLADLYAGYSANETWRLSFGSRQEYDFEREIGVCYQDGTPRWATRPRQELDAAIFNRALQAGAQPLERTAVRGYEVLPDRVRLAVSGSRDRAIEARLLMVAAGSTGRLVQRRAGTPVGVAVRGYYQGPPGEPVAVRWTHDLLPGGYEWQFPIAGGLYNIGVGTLHSVVLARNLRLDERLKGSELVQNKQPVGRLRGGWLNYSFAYNRLPAQAERVMWLGDAAGLVQPHTGEGISQALFSAEAAVEVARPALETGRLGADDLTPYTERLHRKYGGSLRLGRMVLALMRQPRLYQLSGRAVFAAVRLVR